MKNEWIFIKDKLPEIDQYVSILHELYGVIEAKRVNFIVPTRNLFTKKDEFWFWDVSNFNTVEVLLLNEVTHWRPLTKD